MCIRDSHYPDQSTADNSFRTKTDSSRRGYSNRATKSPANKPNGPDPGSMGRPPSGRTIGARANSQTYGHDQPVSKGKVTMESDLGGVHASRRGQVKLSSNATDSGYQPSSLTTTTTRRNQDTNDTRVSRNVKPTPAHIGGRRNQNSFHSPNFTAPSQDDERPAVAKGYGGEFASEEQDDENDDDQDNGPLVECPCLLYTSPSPRDQA
eukprot:TRINITY_DN4547_c0_g2_i1.p1 TRINITY_DN4547_c0_g2~~TRINITY_DN4547_c0_g2_i1.p1  ORF type:complete len:227 (+),score=29.92 TRINITY_DN4547_c0_g2_i1:60-683(+)